MKFCVPVLALIFAVTAALAQPPAAPKTEEKPEIPTLDAAIGPCTADFQVKDASGKAIYAAKIHTLIRYGAFGVKKQELQLSTSYEGKARIVGLPDVNKRPTEFEVSKGDLKTVLAFDPGAECHPHYEVTLK